MPGLELVVGERVVEALHPLEVVDGGELRRHRAADLLGRRVGGAQLGELLLELLEPAQPLVVVGVRQGRAVEHEVAPAGLLDLVGELSVLLTGLGRCRLGVAHGDILPGPTDKSDDTHLTGWRLRTMTVAAASTTRETTVPAPSLTRLDAAGETRGLVLVLHGGKQRSDEVVDGRSLSWRRCQALQRAITPGLHDAGVGRGCCATATGAGTAGRARSRTRVGRSSRYAATTATCPSYSSGTRWAPAPRSTSPTTRQVVGVVGLAPWFPAAEPVTALTGRHLVAAHGRRDKITSFRATAAFVERARPVDCVSGAPRHGPGRPLPAAAGARVERARVHLGAVDAQ